MSPRAGVLSALIGLAVAAPAAAAVIPVTTLLDADAADGECSLREAIVAANLDLAYRECPGGSGADEIELRVPGTVALVADLPSIEDGVTLRGLGAGTSGVDGGGAHRLLEFPGPGNGLTDRLALEGVRLENGLALDGGAVLVGAGRELLVVESVLAGNRASRYGGAVRGADSGVVEVVRSTLAGNVAENGRGGAVSVYRVASLRVIDSTISGNVVAAGPGGGLEVYDVDELLIRRSTLSGNSAGSHGGGLAITLGGGLRIEYSTLVGNLADLDADGVGWGGGLDLAGASTLTLLDSIVAGNEDASTVNGYCPDVDARLGAALSSDGFNLLGVNACAGAGFPAGTPNLNGDFVGTESDPLAPGLGPLADHGGPTATHRPGRGSPAIDQGACPGELADQRGFTNPATSLRVVDDPDVPDFADGCDIGAVERHPDPTPGLPFLDGFESGDTSEWSASVP